MAKFVGVIGKIKPADVERPRVEHAGWKLSARGAVDFYDLLVPAGSEVSYIPVSVDSYCLEVSYEGRRYHFMVSSTSLAGPEEVIEEVPAERCRPLI
jgi:hypothetical protein